MAPSTVFCTECGAANLLRAKFCFSCGHAFEEPKQAMPLQSGLVLKQRYKVLNQIGQGGFGAVYKAEDKELGRRLLAVKEMSALYVSTQEIQEGVEAFKREALMLAGLKHKHLPHIYDHFSENERWYLVMDYIEGETLEARLSKSRFGSLPLVMALNIAGQLCTVLAYLHSRQPSIIFRDLKPANVILTPEGDLYLIDFGIARHFKPGQTKDTIAFGSPGYAAPEQYGKAQTTPRADIYSLGAILHQMITGDDPSLTPFRFSALSFQEPLLQQLLQRMLAMDERMRPASILEVAQILQHVPTVASHLLPVPSRSSQALQVVPSSLPSPAMAPFGASPFPVLPLLVHEHHYGLVRAVSWSPDGRFAASATDVIIRVWNARNGRNITSYREHGGRIKHMTWAPTGTRIASISEERKVRIWDASTGKAIGIYQDNQCVEPSLANVLAWSPDGRYLAIGGHGRIFSWDTYTNVLTEKVRRRAYEYNSLSWSPDGLNLAAACNQKIMIWRALTGKKMDAYHGDCQMNVVAWSPNGKYLACGGEDRAVHVWDVYYHKLMVVNASHSRPICAVSWSPDSRLIVSSGLSGDIDIWEALTGRRLISYQAHGGMVLALAWSPDGNLILSGGSDQRVCIWRAP